MIIEHIWMSSTPILLQADLWFESEDRLMSEVILNTVGEQGLPKRDGYLLPLRVKCVCVCVCVCVQALC